MIEMGNVEGKRVAAPDGKSGGKKVPIIILCVVLAVLAGGYLGLCAWAGGSAFWPNTSVAGVDVSGQTPGQAAGALICLAAGFAAAYRMDALQQPGRD